MSLGDQIRKLRKSLDLTQREFGDRIAIKQNSVAQIEMGRNTSEQTIFAICKEFNVNEQWLRTGEGEMFIPEATDALEALVRERGLSHSDYILIEKFLALTPEEREVVLNYALQVAAAFNAEEFPPAVPTLAVLPKPEPQPGPKQDMELLAIMAKDPGEMTDEEYAVYSREYRRQAIEEKRAEANSRVSPDDIVMQGPA